jgi:hypothetical protein
MTPKIKVLNPPSFVLLVRQMRALKDEADIFEINIDTMRVKGDLAVIRKHFGKPMIARSQSQDTLRRAVKSGFDYIRLPEGMELDLEMRNLMKNKGSKIWEC